MYLGGDSGREMVRRMGELPRKIMEVLAKPGQEGQGEEWKLPFFGILAENHGHLLELGVSIPEIEEIVARHTVEGEKASKLTGGGMGGYVLVVECPLKVPGSCSGSEMIAEMDLRGLEVHYA
jgi:mevalonate kinase